MPRPQWAASHAFAGAAVAGDGAEKRNASRPAAGDRRALLRVPRRPAASADDGRDDRRARAARRRPAAPARRASLRAKVRAPARVSERGPLKAAIVTVRSWRAINARASSSPKPTASMVPSPRAQLVHEPRAQHDDPRAFFQAEHAGDARRGDLADAVADDRRGLDAPRFPQLRQRDLHRENRRLRDLGAVHLRGLLRAAEFLEQREARVHGRIAASQRSMIRGRPARAASARGPCPTIAGPVRSSRRRCAAAARGAA